ncbi:MAG: carbonic anhydrase [Thermoguttaceae bacterium]
MARTFPRALACAASALLLWMAACAWGADPANVSADEAIGRLKDGNQRFAAGKATHDHQGAERRIEVAKGQKPLAIVVSCSDSRVGPEVVFDQGLGDLFVVRTAGNVVDDVGLGSIEYAVEHFGTPLILVLGHQRCGAVSAAVSGGEVHGHVRAVVEAIRPAVQKVKDQPGDPVENAVRANVREVVKRLQHAAPILPDRIKTGKLKIVGAYYDLDDGRVELMR